MSYKYIDIHSHLFFPQFDKDREEVLSSMKENGISTITVGTDLANSKKAIEFAESHDGIFASVGLHPSDTYKETFDDKEFEKLATNKNVVAIGECGLDYFRIDTNKIDERKKLQKEQFEKQIEFAATFDKPLMLHCRASSKTMDAYIDAIDILKSKAKLYGDKVRGNFHFFAGDINIARKVYDIGFTTSFSGVITFTEQYDDVVRFAPRDLIHAETDAPFAAPLPHRGKRNEPNFVIHVVEQIAKLKAEDPATTEKTLLENAKNLFNVAI